MTASVVMPVRNGAGWIEGQLRALADQQGIDFAWEVIVSDNGSTDDTRAVIERASAAMPVAVRVIDSGARPGLSHARNAGVLHARGTMIIFCDCDDLVRPLWLASAVRALRRADMVGGTMYPFIDPSRLGAEEPRGVIRASFGLAVVGCNFGIRRSSYVALRGCDESLPPYGCEDAEFSLRANKAGLRIESADGMDIDFRRTTGAWPNIRKAYLSGVAEAIVVARHPDVYPSSGGLRPAMRRLIGTPAEVYREWRGGGRLNIYAVARRIVAATGFLVGTTTRVGPQKLGPSVLMEPAL